MPPPGVLLLHGFTSSLDTVNGLVPHLEGQGVPFRIPVLRGHGSVPEALLGVTWRDWFEDARQSLLDLAAQTDRAVLIGLSMGGLVALHLAAEHPDRVAGVATVAACLEFRSPLVHLLPLLRRLRTWWPARPDYADPALAARDTNYPRFPLETFASLYAYREVVRRALPRVRAPILVIQSTADPVVRPACATAILQGVSSPHREERWFQFSRHEMMRDVEREQVFSALLDFVQRIRASSQAR